MLSVWVSSHSSVCPSACLSSWGAVPWQTNFANVLSRKRLGTFDWPGTSRTPDAGFQVVPIGDRADGHG